MNSFGSGKATVFPCAACKILRIRCGEKCMLAPYFPPENPHKFATAHRVFGVGNIIKMLKVRFKKNLPNDGRADVVSSMVYEAEAEARLRDPVFILKLHLDQANLVSLVSRLYTLGEESKPFSSSESDPQDNDNDNSADHNNDLFLEDSDPMILWEPLWP
ncbi:hypothetical protein KI387_020934 [Taxus chinensis]|uniref:LOB domain-containing protein n=1 Tax=Taxus chinensis TaxID=29808 RepID=A0AA38GD14_TAXCH|nr:hypothetical protein KI387_020934 [Taxus chinensis]